MFFCMKLGVHKCNKWGGARFYRKKSVFPVFGQIKAKRGSEIGFLKIWWKSSPFMCTFLWVKMKQLIFSVFFENWMFGKILVLRIWPKTLSANQIAAFFKRLYFWSIWCLTLIQIAPNCPGVQWCILIVVVFVLVVASVTVIFAVVVVVVVVVIVIVVGWTSKEKGDMNSVLSFLAFEMNHVCITIFSKYWSCKP